jgi:phosphoglycerate dehydrogenase-like enzyme
VETIAGAAIDVIDPESPPADYPLLAVDDALLMPALGRPHAHGG